MTSRESKVKELRRLSAITRVHQSVGANLEIKDIAHILVRELIEIVDCDGCAFLLIENDRVVVLAERGFTKVFGKKKVDQDLPIIKQLKDSKESVITNDILNSTAASCLPSGCLMNSLLCTPIIVNGEVRGIIHLDSLNKNAFNNDDKELTRILSNEIAIAIERSMLYSEIRDISIRDGLTNCFNRRKLDVDLVAELANAVQNSTELSVMMIDIDWFKKYNDYHGHPKGDIVLKKVSEVLVGNVRPTDTVYRYGGEEFVIIILNLNKDKAFLVAQRLQKAIEREEFEGEQDSQPNGKLTISAGLTTFPLHGLKQNELLQAADLALYEAKHAGRNQVCRYNPQLSK